MRSLEIFSGAGGLAKGLELAGFQHVGFVELNKHACDSLRLNFDEEKVFQGDIKNYDLSSIDKIDIVAGGPPCQPFSLGGKHKAHDDSRDMFPFAIKAIEVLQPKAFIFENVKGLLRKSFADYFEYIILRLTYPCLSLSNVSDWKIHLDALRKARKDKHCGCTYDVSFKLINAADYGVPQIRERVIIVGVRSDLNKKWSFPSVTHTQEKLLWEQHVTGDYWRKHNIDAVIDKGISERLMKRFGIFPPSGKSWVTVRDALKNVPQPYESHGIGDHIFKDGARVYPGHTGSYIDLPSKTLKAGAHGVPGGENMIRYEDGTVRYFTVYEGKLLQTFPREFLIAGAWGEAMRQIGNAVPVLLAQKIGQQLYNLLNEEVEPLLCSNFN
ncbi:DNA cytosine methyltransferase [Salmonella enterica subsp. enterica serovar Agona]|uniref:DNA cytosine methyltransferase n=1 Tax=Escherichia coli TaxID=562 RepID=UPI0012893744|nr:DNA cytosine methyltransferase [Salmonella enterica subsp. enterica serovar Agona]EHR8921477.1 DNA cytosine methyltransferase [Escherichia coli]EHU3727339.1 DNA cytosine methyltransferase [Salmonella enterica]EHU7107022.1 DNA cytosine methyltransferase [Salmonella enterica subsp. enterica serovar Braenderup]EIY5492371.1 DNA cytosine methyltransferase [Salmonella enterica]